MIMSFGGIASSEILIATVVIGAVGLLVGVFLCSASVAFKVEVDPREEAILGVLPGNNCGGCGYAGCSGLASAIVKQVAEVNACPVGGDAVGDKIATIMGVEALIGTRMVAFVECRGSCDKATNKYEYSGIEDCRMVSLIPGNGPKSCSYGCMGYGSCVKECPFDSIHIIDKIAIVDKEKCKACEKCVATCPNNLIKMVPYSAEYLVACSSKDKGAITTKMCEVGCIACQLCKKNCPQDTINIEDNNATIDYKNCVNCGICLEKCPKKTIIQVNA